MNDSNLRIKIVNRGDWLELDDGRRYGQVEAVDQAGLRLAVHDHGGPDYTEIIPWHRFDGGLLVKGCPDCRPKRREH